MAHLASSMQITVIIHVRPCQVAKHHMAPLGALGTVRQVVFQVTDTASRHLAQPKSFIFSIGAKCAKCAMIFPY